jgi:glycosyltransferase involved in cell wall biosynthesis
VLRLGFLADTLDRPGGIGRYSREVLAALGRRSDVQVVVASSPASATDAARLAGPCLASHLAIPQLGQLGIALWERHYSGVAFRRAEVDVVHSTKHLVPKVRCPTMLTVHDMMTITRAHESNLMKRWLLPAQYRTSLESATALVAVSRATAAAIGREHEAWSAKTTVIPNGVSAGLLTGAATPVPAVADDRFALIVGDLSPRKNVAFALDLWDRIAEATGLVLLVVGDGGPGSAPLRRRLQALDPSGPVRWRPRLGDPELRWCYERAQVVLLPSLDEGFGLPLLEARAFGAPVIASTADAFVEVSGGAPDVSHLDPGDASAWSAAIITAASAGRAPAVTPALPGGAISWDEHTDRALALARSLLAH